MKKSKSIKLILLATTAIIISGCDNNQVEKPKVYQSEQQCIDEIHDPEACHAAILSATKEHVNNTPHFNSIEECESQFGQSNCTSPQNYGSSGSFFMPIMSGFLIGKLLNGNGYAYSSVYKNSNGHIFSGDCRDNNGNCDTNSSHYVGYGGGRGIVYNSGFVNRYSSGEVESSTMSRSSISGYTRSGSISRGGFGEGFSGGHASSAGE